MIPLFSLLFACGPTEVYAVDFDQTCEVAEDCVAVIEGDTCGCGCDYAAIRADDLSAWQEAQSDAMGNCGGAIPDCAACPAAVVSCDAGRCSASTVDE